MQLIKSKPSHCKICCVKGCTRTVLAKRVCAAHYQRMMIHGTTQPERPIGDHHGFWHPNWKGGISKLRDGRRLIFCPNHPRASAGKGRYVFNYLLVVESMIGRRLKDNEIVHHKNNNCNDDRPENLEVMTKSEHSKHHYKDLLKDETGKFKKQ